MDMPDTFTSEVSCPDTLDDLLARLRYLHGKRAAQHEAHRAENPRRKSLGAEQREDVLKKTGTRCHICGGLIDDKRPWQADHVLAFSGQGLDSPENYLPAHGLCNHYRWDFLSEEFQWILKMGVWSRTLMKNSSRGDGLGRKMAERFFKGEQHNKQRRENRNKKSGGLAQSIAQKPA